jgi:uncharacterized protein (DUF305 family)
MNRIFRRAFTVALAVGLSSCGPSASDADPESHSNGHGDSHSADAHPAAGMAMHQAMAAAVGADVSDTWLRKMIEHHKGAIAMTDSLVARGGEPAVVEIARRMGAQQRREIEEMQRLVRKDAAPDPASARPFAASEKQMDEAMAGGGGSGSPRDFLRQMIPHHRGAITMSRVVLAQGGDERVAALARRIVADQGREIAEMEAMLSDSAKAPGKAAGD